MSTANNLIKDLPKGPLDAYRKRATFDWKSLKLTLESEDGVRFQVFKLISFNYVYVLFIKRDRKQTRCQAFYQFKFIS